MAKIQGFSNKRIVDGVVQEPTEEEKVAASLMRPGSSRFLKALMVECPPELRDEVLDRVKKELGK